MSANKDNMLTCKVETECDHDHDRLVYQDREPPQPAKKKKEPDDAAKKKDDKEKEKKEKERRKPVRSVMRFILDDPEMRIPTEHRKFAQMSIAERWTRSFSKAREDLHVPHAKVEEFWTSTAESYCKGSSVGKTQAELEAFIRNARKEEEQREALDIHKWYKLHELARAIRPKANLSRRIKLIRAQYNRGEFKSMSFEKRARIAHLLREEYKAIRASIVVALKKLYKLGRRQMRHTPRIRLVKSRKYGIRFKNIVSTPLGMPTVPFRRRIHGLGRYSYPYTSQFYAGEIIATRKKGNYILMQVLVDSIFPKQRLLVSDIEKLKPTFIKRHKVIGLPRLRASPKFFKNALFKEGDAVLALYPQTTCFYKGIVKSVPKTVRDKYVVVFEDPAYASGFSKPFPVSQGFVLPIPKRTKFQKMSRRKKLKEIETAINSIQKVLDDFEEEKSTGKPVPKTKATRGRKAAAPIPEASTSSAAAAATTKAAPKTGARRGRRRKN